MDYEKTIEELEETLTNLQEDNKKIPIIVEGNKDIKALRKLGITGIIISMNKGMRIADFCDTIAKYYSTIILLTDWDKKGGQLYRLITKNLHGRVTCNTKYREIFAKHSLTHTVEGLPSWIKTLKQKIH